ncbi:MAG: amidohydrolase family protein, partial [Pseudomonadota bacterium]
RVFPLEAQWVSAELVRDATRLACAEMSAGGITTFADMYFYPDATIEAAGEARMRIVAGLPATNVKTPWADGLDEHLEKSLAVFDQYRSAANVNFQFAPDSTNLLVDADLTRIKTLADQLDLFVHTNFQETEAQARVSVEKFGATPIERLQHAGLLNERLSGAHAVYLSEDDLTAVAAAGAHVVHCPTSNAKLAAGSAPISEYHSKNVVVALGTDSALSNNALDMLREMRSAAMIARLRTGDATALDARQCLSMATIGGARALGLSHEIGSLEIGKFADVVCVDLDEPNCWPVYDPVTQLVFAADRHQISDTWVAGDAIYSDNKHQHLDLDWVRERALEWFQRIQPPTK